MKSVLVTWATGFVGYAVSRQLAASGIGPRLIVRRPDRGPLLAALDAERIQDDLIPPASLTRATRDVDAVIHLRARTLEDRSLKPTIVDGSLALMHAAPLAGMRQSVFACSFPSASTTAAGPSTPARDLSRY